MRKSLSLFFFFILLFFSKTIFAFEEKIEDFSVEILINEDSSFFLKEKIVWNFGNFQKHGIFREIPLKKIDLKFEKAVDEENKEYETKIERKGEIMIVRIGNPNVLVSGIKTYILNFRVFHGVSFFKDFDEIYWNVTGNQWKVPIKTSSVKIILPKEVDNLKVDCFTGPLYSTEKDCGFEILDKKTVYLFTKRTLYPTEGFTIVLGLPKGILKEPSLISKILFFLKVDYPIWIVIFVFLYLFQEWWRKGKDPRIERAIVPQYQPPEELSVGETAFLLKQKIEGRDVTATLVDLAVRGYIKIRNVEKEGIFLSQDVEIEKLRDFDGLLEHEKFLLEEIFKDKNKVLISSLKGKFSNKITAFAKIIAERLTKEGYFEENPYKASQRIAILGIILFISGAIFSSFGNFDFHHLLPFSLIFSGILCFIFAVIAPKRSKKGRDTLWYILGFRDYIKTAEKYRAQFYEKENIFEKYLPYAISFNMVKKWAKAFEGIYNRPPQWYETRYPTVFTIQIFSNSLNFTTSQITRALTFSPRSGFSRGFSGGGRGGGGGGSW